MKIPEFCGSRVQPLAWKRENAAPGKEQQLCEVIFGGIRATVVSPHAVG
jgi:hypothetical protein